MTHNPYESPAAVEERSMDLSDALGRAMFALMLLLMLTLVPVSAVAAWSCYRPDRFGEYVFLLPLDGVLLVAGIVISAAGTMGRLPKC